MQTFTQPTVFALKVNEVPRRIEKFNSFLELNPHVNAIYLGLFCSLSCNVKATEDCEETRESLTPKHASLRLTNVLMTMCDHRLPPRRK